MLRYAFFGPVGTFSEAALRSVVADAPAVAMPSVDATIEAVRSGAADVGCVPIENSVEGGVPATLDGLAAGDPLVVVAEVVLPVTFVLAVKPGTALADVERVSTHSHAHAQVRGWLRTHLPDALYVPATSTAAAAQALADELAGGAPAGFEGAVCAPTAARGLGLDVLAERIEDRAGAQTRFVLLSRPGAGTVPAPTGDDKTSLVVFLREERPGALVEALEQFVTRGINLTRIESRPAGDALGRYCFSIDCDGHVSEARVGEALMGLHRVSDHVRFVGSYPRAGGGRPPAGTGPTEDDFAAAQGWLDRLRAGAGS
ncbi:prephenate dehydratase [Kineococcus radiotolerans]|uniref:Prephenate dehydratase n=2 Tax=Kineococcus radiotolerans TaxID=131568 RepID=A6W4J6_KINRD|nr:prephenate dehydratase [Kineococcus radiotolerans]ABS01735.1 Prephenate dehydratase [Kineococcus radiotolerans SRS30216 = ATCC BAA-149]MBB2901134.1 prephenate dehydratase [Kineococcus radiotolerans]